MSIEYANAIGVLRQLALTAAIDALRRQQSTIAVRTVFERRYQGLVGVNPQPDIWTRIETQAAVCASFPKSDRHDLATRYEALTGRIPPTLTLEDLRRCVAELEVQHTEGSRYETVGTSVSVF